jgi:hypothetical protein
MAHVRYFLHHVLATLYPVATVEGLCADDLRMKVCAVDRAWNEKQTTEESKYKIKRSQTK